MVADWQVQPVWLQRAVRAEHPADVGGVLPASTNNSRSRVGARRNLLRPWVGLGPTRLQREVAYS